MKITYFSTFIILIFGGFLTAGVRNISGASDGFWDNYLVVWGEITESLDVPNEDFMKEIKVECIATLAGNLDPSITPNLVARYRLIIDSAIQEGVEPGMSYLILIESKPDQAGVRHIPSEFVDFFPSNTAFFRCQSLSDDEVKQISANLKGLRGPNKDSVAESNEVQKRLKLLRERGVDTTELEKKYGVTHED
ncbi:hypothetical protein [Cerasicoccus maritimus]|uniref:hypothetical protein n=1 Tax=Cerasicoccus maritimus TaxID=490089 RepID=UPI002852C007|nr:hypothetical protein [Cerasicoccus maritimus]